MKCFLLMVSLALTSGLLKAQNNQIVIREISYMLHTLGDMDLEGAYAMAMNEDVLPPYVTGPNYANAMIEEIKAAITDQYPKYAIESSPGRFDYYEAVLKKKTDVKDYSKSHKDGKTYVSVQYAIRANYAGEPPEPYYYLSCVISGFRNGKKAFKHRSGLHFLFVDGAEGFSAAPKLSKEKNTELLQLVLKNALTGGKHKGYMKIEKPRSSRYDEFLADARSYLFWREGDTYLVSQGVALPDTLLNLEQKLSEGIGASTVLGESRYRKGFDIRFGEGSSMLSIRIVATEPIGSNPLMSTAYIRQQDQEIGRISLTEDGYFRGEWDGERYLIQRNPETRAYEFYLNEEQIALGKAKVGKSDLYLSKRHVDSHVTKLIFVAFLLEECEFGMDRLYQEIISNE